MSEKKIIEISLVVFILVFFVIFCIGGLLFRRAFEGSPIHNFILGGNVPFISVDVVPSEYSLDEEEEEGEEDGENSKEDIEERALNSECTDLSGKSMTFEKARQITSESACVQEGKILVSGSCNVDTGTWWVNLDTDKENCFPACVVNIETEEVEINWRCTGLIVDQEK